MSKCLSFQSFWTAMRPSGIVSPALLLLIALLPTRAQDAITALRNDYAGPASLCRVNVDGRHAAVDMLGRPVEVRVVNGAIVHGSFLSLRGARDVPVARGSVVRIVGISAGTNQKNDVLRINVVVSGTAIPIAFLLQKGTLPGMNEAQLRATIETVLDPVHAAPVAPQQSQSSPAPPPSAPKPQQVASDQPARTPLAVESVDELNEILRRCHRISRQIAMTAPRDSRY